MRPISKEGKKLKWILLLFLFPIHAFSSLFLEPGVGGIYESSKFTQNTPSTATEHKGLGLGAEVLGRAGFGIGVFRFGLVGAMSAISERHQTNKYVNNVPDYATYSNSISQTLLGPYFALVDGKTGLRLFGEYYQYTHRKYTYAELDKSNPFRKYDEQDGYGFGIGVGAYYQFFAATIGYRNLRFNEYDFKNDSVRTDLRNNTFSREQVHEMIIQISVPIEIGFSKAMAKASSAGAISKAPTEKNIFSEITKSIVNGLFKSKRK